MDWFFYALLAPAIWAMVNIIDHNLVNKLYKDPYGPSVVSGFFSLFIFIILIFFVQVDFSSLKIIALGILGGMFLLYGQFFYFKTLMHEPPSVTLALWQLYPAILPFLAFIFLGEVLEFKQYIGFIIVLITAVSIPLLTSRNIGFSKNLIPMLWASILVAFSALFLKIVYVNSDFWTGFMLNSLGMGIAGITYVLFSKTTRVFLSEFRINVKKYFSAFISVEILDKLAIFFGNLAISLGPVSLVKVMEGTTPIYLLVFAIILYPFFPKYFAEASQGNKKIKFALMAFMIFGLYLIH